MPPDNTKFQRVYRYVIKSVYYTTLTFVLAAITLYGSEFIFRAFLLRPFVPNTLPEFMEKVASRWPRSVSPVPLSGTIRILGLSDSNGVAGGFGNFFYLLEEQLRKEGFPVDLVNFSVPAFELVEERVLFNKFGSQYHPHIVLHVVFVGNDLADHPVTSRSFHGMTVSLSSGFPYRLKDFAVLRIIYGIFLVYKNRQETKQEGLHNKEVGTFSEEKFLWIEYVRSKFFRPDVMRDLWPQAENILDGLVKEVQSSHRVYVLAVLPDQLQLDPELQKALFRRYGLNFHEFDWYLPQNLLKEFARKRRIHYLDLMPYLVKGGGAALYLLRDAHLNEKGNQVVARALADTLRPLLVRSSSSTVEKGGE